jgi:hypothetical protein
LQGPSLVNFNNAKESFPQEIQKHLVADISVLNLRLMMMGHVFGAFVLHFLERDRVRTVVRRLSVDLVIACSCFIIISHIYILKYQHKFSCELGLAEIFHT